MIFAILVRAFEAAAQRGDAAARYRANRAFHVRMADLCENRELAKLALTVRGDLPTVPIVQWRSQARIEQSCREHGLMIDALAARDAAGLAKLVALHIRQPEEGAASRRRRSA